MSDQTISTEPGCSLFKMVQKIVPSIRHPLSSSSVISSGNLKSGNIAFNQSTKEDSQSPSKIKAPSSRLEDD